MLKLTAATQMSWVIIVTDHDRLDMLAFLTKLAQVVLVVKQAEY